MTGVMVHQTEHRSSSFHPTTGTHRCQSLGRDTTPGLGPAEVAGRSCRLLGTSAGVQLDQHTVMIGA